MNQGQTTNIFVLGAGSYGTCLAILLAHAGHRVTLWCRRRELAEALVADGENRAYLPGFALPAGLAVTHELAAVAAADFVLGVTPSHAVRTMFTQLAPLLAPHAVVVNAAKGLEEGTLFTIEDIFAQVLSPAHAARATYLSGPTFARELAARLPGAIVLAGRDEATTIAAQHALSTDTFRIYTSTDVAGVLLGGALKNVIAIAVGIADGLAMGSNARAALITRGLAEIARLGVARGADPLTFAGLSGLGDLVLTCSGDASRNRRVGLALGQGQPVAQATGLGNMVAEGVKTTAVAHALAASLAVDAPIVEAMYSILFAGQPPAQAMARMLTRSLKSERV